MPGDCGKSLHPASPSSTGALQRTVGRSMGPRDLRPFMGISNEVTDPTLTIVMHQRYLTALDYDKYRLQLVVTGGNVLYVVSFKPSEETTLRTYPQKIGLR